MSVNAFIYSQYVDFKRIAYVSIMLYSGAMLKNSVGELRCGEA